MASYLNNFQNNTMPQVNTMNPVAPLPQQQNMMPVMQSPQFVLPQPVGNVYNLNNSNEIGNVPAGLGMSLGLCLNENLLYIKTLQNNAPALLTYRLVPFEGNVQPQEAQVQSAATAPENEDIKQLRKEIAEIKETLLKKLGEGGTKWQL